MPIHSTGTYVAQLHSFMLRMSMCTSPARLTHARGALNAVGYVLQACPGWQRQASCQAVTCSGRFFSDDQRLEPHQNMVQSCHGLVGRQQQQPQRSPDSGVA